MRLSWNGEESGAPQCAPLDSFTGGKAPEVIRAELGQASDEEVAQFILSLFPALKQFISKATLEPGQYTLNNMPPALLEQTKYGLQNADELFNITEDMVVTVTKEDIELAKGAYWKWPYPEEMEDAMLAGVIPGPKVDSKRPYGDMSYYALDIHRILSWSVISSNENGRVELSKDQENEATKLHFRQLGVMQAFLEHAKIEIE